MDKLKTETIRVFDIGQSLIPELKTKISEFSQDNDAENKEFMQGFTFKSALEFLNHIEVVIYNNDNKKLLKSAQEDSPELQKIFDIVDQNNKHIFEIETYLNVFFKNLN